MDFLDPQKQKAHARRLIAGYILIGMVLLLATVVLLYQLFGYGIDRHGRVFQSGLVFISSLPDNAEIYVDGQRQSSTTNTRLVLPAGQYVFELKRDGYRTWKRAITVEGSTLQRFEYPLLFAETLEPSTVKQYAAPALATQSPDKRWLLVQADAADSFDLYDINADEPVPSALTIPLEVLSAGSTTTGWQQVEWSKDNRHVVLNRSFTKSDGQQASEYILFDRENANASVNLSVLLGFTPSVIQLRDKNYDQYYVFDQPKGLLFTANLNQPTPQPYLSDVLVFQSEAGDNVLYATGKEAAPGKTLIRLRQGDDNYTIRQVDAAAPYLLDLARYDNAWYIAAGASGEERVYVYKNPVDALKSSGDVLVPVHILKAARPTWVEFAPESRFVVSQGGQDFAVYDVKNNKGYAFQLETPVDSAFGHAVWTDQYHLATSTGGQTLVFDYDGTNRQVLSPINPASQPIFSREYRRLYTLTTANLLTSTELRAPRDR